MATMTDRELLEAAARAASHEVWTDIDSNLFCETLDLTEGPWNPLTDDGDALRLAVSLKLEVRPGTWAIIVARDGVREEVPRNGNDDSAATRRAIVRAAAAMAAGA